MDFKLSFTPKAPAHLLNYKQPLLLTGSCFSDNIASLLGQHGFNLFAQPNGVVFNPISIAQHLKRIINKQSYTESELTQYNELWHSWQHHSSFSKTNALGALTEMNDALTSANEILVNHNSQVVITLGSAMVYTLAKNTDTLVANCHKYPQQHFTKTYLSVSQIWAAFNEVISLLKDKQIYFTVSPVRHVRDGLVENNLSKSVLLQAVHHLCSTHSNCYYFPAYEIVLDELRDYRFYADDLVHPNKQAIEYVWQRFVETCMDTETQFFVEEMEAWNLLNNHKIIHTNTKAHKQFEETKAKKMQQITQKYGVKLS